MRERKEENTISITVTGRREMCTNSMLMTHQENASRMQLFSVTMQILRNHRQNHNISINTYRRKDFLLKLHWGKTWQWHLSVFWCISIFILLHLWQCKRITALCHELQCNTCTADINYPPIKALFYRSFSVLQAHKVTTTSYWLLRVGINK